MNRRLFSLLFLLSGYCGLMYEIFWTRLFSIVHGSTYLAISSIVASFMFGLFFGAYLIGKFMHRVERPLRLYAILELFIGAYALLLLLFFGAADGLFVSLNEFLKQIPLLNAFTKFLLTLVLIGAPTTAMGATLPLVIEHFTKKEKLFAENVSWFYAINTLGGALGVLTAGFILIEYLGLRHGIAAAASLNLLIGGAVWYFFVPGEKESTRAIPAAQKQKPMTSLASRHDSRWRGLYVAAAGLSGFAALAFEIVWTRGLKFLIHSSTYSFSIMLFTFLAGIALGSLWARKIIRTQSDLHGLYGKLQLALGFYALFSIFILYSFSYTPFFQNNVLAIIYDYSYSWLWTLGIYALTCILLLFVPTLLMGILFPMVSELYFQETEKKPGQTVSLIYAVNTLGSILGSLSAGILLIPLMGIKNSILLISGINIGLGFAFMWRHKLQFRVALGISAVLLMVLIPLSREGKYLYGHGENPGDRIRYYKEGLMATVKVYQRKKHLNMSIDGMQIASTSAILFQKEKLIAHLPFLIRPNLEQVLSVGLASGISTGTMALYPQVEQIDCVELIKPVFDAARIFKPFNFDVFNNPRVNFIHNDVYAFLKYSHSRYDLISSDGKLGPLYSGNTIMLARDYYDLCKTHLKEDGLFIQWVPLITPSGVMKTILETLKKSFPHVALFYFYPSDVFMVASPSPIAFDTRSMKKVFEDSTIRKDLKPFFIQDPADVLTSFIGFYEGPGKNSPTLNTFDRPVLEFDYLKEWKKSSNIPGGYRAENLQLLTDIFKQTGRDDLTSHIQGSPAANYSSRIYQSSLAFYNFAIQNFKQGNYLLGLRRYIQLKGDLQ